MSREVHDAVRASVRRVLETVPEFASADPAARRALAERMVGVALLAAGLAEEERRLDAQVRRRARPLATGQDAGKHLGMQATNAAGDVVRNVRDSIDFPSYVSSLITGVFQAILTSTTVQLGSLGELLDNVAASADDFESTVGDAEVMRWLLGKFDFLVATDDGIAVRPGTDLADHMGQLQAGLRASESDVGGIDAEDLAGSLLPLARRRMAQDKQQILGTMVQMGLQRIVVDEGRITASMDLRVDAASGAQQGTAQRDDWRVNAAASGSFGVGPWSASASASTSVGQVKSDNQYTTEQIGVRAGLRSSVELAFRTEQVPLDRMADASARVKLDHAARVPADVSGASILGPAPAPTSFNPSLDVPPTPGAPTAPVPPDVQKAQQASKGSAAPAGDVKAGDVKAGDVKTGDVKAGDAKAGDVKTGDAKTGDAKAGDAKAGDAKQAGGTPQTAGAPSPPAPQPAAPAPGAPQPAGTPAPPGAPQPAGGNANAIGPAPR
jgi:hypothetical protein